MAIARNDLGRDGLDSEAHLRCHISFDAGIDVGESADGTGDRAGRDLGAGGIEAGAGAGEFGVGLRQLQPESGGLGVDAVAAADGGGKLVLEGSALEGREHVVNVGEQKIGGAHELHVEAGIEHVGGGHAR